MKRTDMMDYETARREFSWDVPATFNFGGDERRQLEANMKSWRIRLEQFDRDLDQEPQRIRAFYEVRAKRVEPVGLV